MINNWILLGPANGLKTQIVIEKLILNPVIKDKPFVFVCESDKGCAIDYAKSEGITVHILKDPRMLSTESLYFFENINADLLVACGWNFRIPKIIFNCFKYPSLNCHSSLLPDYKGQRAYVHQWANCENEYGATIHLIAEEFDSGKILLQGGLKLFLKENLVIIHQRLSEITGFLLPQALLLLELGNRGTTVNLDGKKSRYFLKISPKYAKMYRILNLIFRKFSIKPYLTPNKVR